MTRKKEFIDEKQGERFICARCSYVYPMKERIVGSGHVCKYCSGYDFPEIYDKWFNEGRWGIPPGLSQEEIESELNLLPGVLE